MPEGPKNYEPVPETELPKKFNFNDVALPGEGTFPYGETGYEERNQQILDKIKSRIEGDFPKTYDFTLGNSASFENTLQQYYVNSPYDLEFINQHLAELNKSRRNYPDRYHGNIKECGAYIRSKSDQVYKLYYIASCLKEARLDEQDPITDIRKVLQGKKILVLGDDIGSSSELLLFYGAESYGIENDRLNLLVGHSGLLAEDGKPQTQLLEGNIVDLFKDNPELLAQLRKHGPFDMIVSFSIFNDSGVEDAVRQGASFITKHQAKTFQTNCSELLKDNGTQLHYKVYSFDAFPREFMYDTGTRRGHEIPSVLLIPKSGGK